MALDKQIRTVYHRMYFYQFLHMSGGEHFSSLRSFFISRFGMVCKRPLFDFFHSEQLNITTFLFTFRDRRQQQEHEAAYYWLRDDCAQSSKPASSLLLLHTI